MNVLSKLPIWCFTSAVPTAKGDHVDPFKRSDVYFPDDRNPEHETAEMT